jgi:hypothetical protein
MSEAAFAIPEGDEDDEVAGDEGDEIAEDENEDSVRELPTNAADIELELPVFSVRSETVGKITKEAQFGLCDSLCIYFLCNAIHLSDLI